MKHAQAEIYNKEGLQLKIQGNHEEAAKKFQLALGTCPREKVESINIYKKNLALTFQCIGNDSYIQKNYEKAKDVYKNAHEMLIECYKSDKSYEKDMKQAESRIYNNEGHHLFDQEKHKEAVKKYQKAVDTCPRNINNTINKYKKNIARSFQCLGNDSYNQKNYKKALEFYNAAHDKLTECYKSDKMYENEMKLAKAIIYNSEGSHFRSQGKYEEAVLKFQLANEACPSDKVEWINKFKNQTADCFFELGNKYNKLREYEKAKEFYDKAYQKCVDGYENKEIFRECRDEASNKITAFSQAQNNTGGGKKKKIFLDLFNLKSRIFYSFYFLFSDNIKKGVKIGDINLNFHIPKLF